MLETGKTLLLRLTLPRGANKMKQRVIIFYSVILQHAQDFNNTKYIRAQIYFRLDFWNRGVFDKLANET